MTSRLIVASALSLALLSAGFAAMWAGVEGWYGLGTETTSVSQGEWASYIAERMWLETLARAGGPLIAAGLIAGIGALALLVLSRRERRA
jgi:hypothetical protein